MGGGERRGTAVEGSAIRVGGGMLPGECCHGSKMAWTARAVVVIHPYFHPFSHRGRRGRVVSHDSKSEKFSQLPPWHSAGSAQPCGRLCVSSKGPLTRFRWNINKLPSGSRAPPRGDAEADFHGAPLPLYNTLYRQLLCKLNSIQSFPKLLPFSYATRRGFIFEINRRIVTLNKEFTNSSH